LSQSSTIQLNAIFYYETFPNQSEKDILVLATPSAEYDPLSLEIYSHAISRQPPAVMLSENPMGEWFADVIESISNVLNYIPHPFAQKLGMVGKPAAGALRVITGNTASKPTEQTLQILPDRGPAPPLPPRDSAHGYRTQNNNKAQIQLVTTPKRKKKKKTVKVQMVRGRREYA